MNKVRIKWDKKGFTLIELIVVLAILGLLISIITPNLTKWRDQANDDASRANLRGIQSALELYFTRYKYYPNNIKTLITENYLAEGNDKDPWDRYYNYQAVIESGQITPNNYLLSSSGKDGRNGSDDDIECPINTTKHSFKVSNVSTTVR